MQKLFTLTLFFFFALNIQNTKAQTWYAGVPVYFTITQLDYYGGGCSPTPTCQFTFGGSAVTGVDYYFRVDSLPTDSVIMNPGTVTLAVGDSFLIPPGFNTYTLFYQGAGGLAKYSFTASGTPTVVGEDCPCVQSDLWMSNLMFCPEGISYVQQLNCTVQAAVMTVTVYTTSVTCADSCNGTADIVVTGATPPVTYTWSTGQSTSSLSGLCAGSYDVIITDGAGNTATATAPIPTHAPVTLIISANNASCSTCADGSASVTASGGVGNYTYSWSNGSTDDSINNQLPGEYLITVTDSNGCWAFDTAFIDFNSLAGNQIENSSFQLLTNPVNDLLEVKGNFFGATQIEISDLTGRKIISEKIISSVNKMSVDVSALLPSVYFIHIVDENKSQTLRFVKQ